MTDWLRDARVGLRSLFQKPGFTLVAVLTLAVGMGANTAIYTLVQAVMLHPLPFPEPERLVQIWETAERDELELRSLSFPVLEDMRAAQDVFDSVAGSFPIPLSLGGGTEPERIMGEGVSPTYFSMLGATTLRGRFFTDEDDRIDANHPNVVLSEALWERRFGADNAIIGRDILVNEITSTVVGVVSGQGFTGDTELWFPLETTPQLAGRIGPGRFEQRGARWLSAVGRLNTGVSHEVLDAWMARETERLRADYPRVMERRGVLALPLEEQLFGDVQQAATILMIAVGLVMLIACANLANLLLARGVAREREVALRMAIGATRVRIVRQLLTESLILAFLGGAVGVVIASWAKDILRGASAFEQLPGYVELGIDAQTLGFATLLCIATALVFGAAPAIASARSQPGSTLKGGRGPVASGKSWLSSGRGLLVSVQVALAVLLTVASGLMLRSLSKQLAIDPGFRSDGVYTLRVQLPPRRYDTNEALGFSRQLEDRIGALPGVESVALSSDVPLVDGYSARIAGIEDRLSDASNKGAEGVRVYHHSVSPGFFSTLHVVLLAGRDFSWFDNEEAPLAAIVSKKMAERAWPGESPLGKRMTFSGADGPWRTVIGVVEDIRYRDLVADTVATPDDPDVYSPLAQAPTRSLGIVVEASRATASLESVRAEIRAMDPAIPVYAVHAMVDVLDEELALPRFASSLLGLFGAVALLLAALGLYGLLTHLVAQRSREIGIQMALGASGAQLSRRIVGQGLTLAGVGIVFGLVASVAFGRFLESRLFEVSGTDPWTLVGCALLLVAVAIVASYLPARRATRLDPMLALRQQ